MVDMRGFEAEVSTGSDPESWFSTLETGPSGWAIEITKLIQDGIEHQEQHTN